MLKKLRTIPREELTYERLNAAYLRRLKNIPHYLSWRFFSGKRNQNYKDLQYFQSLHRGERCFILGNGPSLNQMDLSPLRNEYTFGLNRIYLMFDRLGFETSYYVAMNDLVIKQSIEPIKNIKCSKFINWRTRHVFANDARIVFLYERFTPTFSRDLTNGIWGGATVTYAAIQIAYYMGFEQVILIGVDHNYETTGTPHKVVVSQGADPNHFDPTYFSNGVLWQLPDLSTSTIAYRMAKDEFETDGREVLDATIGGKLNVFRKIDYWALVKKVD